MKKVVVLNQSALPRSQGGITRHVDLFGLLHGWTTNFIVGSRNYTTQQEYEPHDSRFVLVRVPAYSGESLARVLGWLRFTVLSVVMGARLGRVDVVYASTPHLLTPVGGWLLARLKRAALVVEVRDLWPESLVSAGSLRKHSRLHRILVGLERWIYHRADAIVVVTDGWQEHFLDLGVEAAKLTILPNGTEPSEFTVARDRGELRQEFGLDRFTALYAGAHGPTNGLSELIAAARELPGVDVVLIGSGGDKARLIEESRDLTNVRFLDAMPKSELALWLAAVDVGVHCVRPLSVLGKGMSPNKVYDYMAARLPIVSNAGVGIRRIMEDGECGRTGLSGTLVESLEFVRDASPDVRLQWGDTGARLVEECHSRRAAARRLEDLLDSVSSR